MTRSLFSWLRGASGRNFACRLASQRWPIVPALLVLEDRTLLSVQFTPASYTVPANRPDTPLTTMSSRAVEPYVSVNPVDPGNIAISSQLHIRVSADAGGTFTNATVFGPAGQGGDTSTTYDSAGRLFWLNLRTFGGLSGVGIHHVDPATGGVLNSHVVDVVPDSTFSDDKDFIAADPNNNNLYVIWTRFGPGGVNSTPVLMRYSSDQGVSWSAPVQVDNGSDNFVWPATVTVAPDHRVYAAYHSVTDNLNGQPDVPEHDGKIVVVRFNNDLTDPVRSIAELPGRADITFNIQTAGFARQIPGATFFTQGSAQPWILADPARPGNIYVISEDSNNGFHQDYGDIRLARSTDYGETWSNSLIETASALFPNAAIDQNGDIVVAWYDNRRGLLNAVGHFKLDVYATYSTDGGLTFAPAFPVNDQTAGVNTPAGNVFDADPGAITYVPGPPQTTRIGEYFGLAVWAGTAYVAWNGNLFGGFNHPVDEQVWTKAFAIRGSLTVTGTPDSDNIAIRSIANNPAFVEVIVNGQRQYAGLWSALTGIIVNPTPGDDVIEIDNAVAGTPVAINLGGGTDSVFITPGNLDAIQAPVSVDGGSSSALFLIMDAFTATNTTYTITGSSVSRPGSAVINYSDFGGLLRVAGGHGDDIFNLVGTNPSRVSAFGQSTGSNTLNIDDGSNAADTGYTITNSSVARTGAAAISYVNMRNLLLTGGSGNNTYNVASTPSGSATTLNTGPETDTVNVRGAAGPLFMNSGTGGDTISLSNNAATLGGIGHVIINDPSNSAAVTVDDSGFAGSASYTLTSTQVAAAAWPNFLLVYNNLASLNLNASSGDDRFNIESTASRTTTTVTAGRGSNRFNLTPMAQYLAGVAGPLNLVGGGADALVFWDTANPNAETYTFDDIPSTLALATVPGFATDWSGMAAVYLETNGMSTANDPSASVLVDVPPPAPAPGPARGTPPPLSQADLSAIADLDTALPLATLPNQVGARGIRSAPPKTARIQPSSVLGSQ
jgi:hypothetical protein